MKLRDFCEKRRIIPEKLDCMTKFQKICRNRAKDIAFSAVFCYNNTEFADSMHARQDRRLPTPVWVLAETLNGLPCDGKRASTTNPPKEILCDMEKEILISLRGVSKAFDGETILDNISLDIHDKEFVTLLGPSGCGKTTTLRIIGGFETADIPTKFTIFCEKQRILPEKFV